MKHLKVTSNKATMHACTRAQVLKHALSHIRDVFRSKLPTGDKN